MAIIHSPLLMAAHLERAPAATLSAVWPTEPPTGWPPKNPEARLPRPWAVKSRRVDEVEPSGFGTASATPAPWISTRAATAAAPATTPASSAARVGICGQRQAARDRAGVLDADHRRGSQEDHGDRRDQEGHERAEDGEAGPAEDHQDQECGHAGDGRGWTSISPGLVTTSHAFCTASPDASTPSRSGSWPSTMFTAMPVRKPNITE